MDQLIPLDIGPLNPNGWELIAGLVCFALVYFPLAWWILPRVRAILQERAVAIHGVRAEADGLQTEADRLRDERDAILAAARHDAAHTRQRAYEEGTALVTAARAEGARERERIIAAGAVEIEAERTVAAEALRGDVDRLGRELAERVLGEPLNG
ncbi:hypothetical protein ACFVIM_26875 [Streptomyces sp. NPDC057638]|uniref:F0F1 ATP synthase subunit B family protein n=1 Tax=Streptomyces sp. NPDC057638 TaxID=3346190 RepID=UPI0036A52CD0